VSKLHRFIAGVYVDSAGKLRPKTAALFDLERKKREQKP
jgi:hypothetical protein